MKLAIFSLNKFEMSVLSPRCSVGPLQARNVSQSHVSPMVAHLVASERHVDVFASEANVKCPPKPACVSVANDGDNSPAAPAVLG